MEGNEQEAIDYEGVHHVHAAEHAIEDDTQPRKSGAPKLVPSERRRLRKEMKAAGVRAKEEARCGGSGHRGGRCSARASVGTTRRDECHAYERPAQAGRHRVAGGRRAHTDQARLTQSRRDEGTQACQNLGETRARRSPGERAPDALLAAALHIQQHARAWLRCRTKARRKRRSRAARHIQRSVRTWFLSRDTPPVTSSIPATVVESGNEGDDEDQSLCVVCLERPRVMLFLTCAPISVRVKHVRL